MKAYTRNKYGGPEVLRLEETGMPEVKNDQLLVKVMANSANPADWHIIRGKPFFARFTFGLFRPKDKIPGADFAGIVEATGKDVQGFKPGDRVFGETLRGGAFAAYVSAPASVCALMPDAVGFPEMAAIPIAGLTALQAVLTHGKLKEGESVLINGSSGGVGHFAVQIAQAAGANVTAVCSSGNTDFVRSLGADHVIAYDKENIHRHSGKYDLVIDTNGNLSHRDFKRMGRRGVITGFTTMRHMMTVALQKAFSRFPLVQFTASARPEDLQQLAGWVQEGKIRPRIEKIYSWKDIPEAISYIEKMRTRGKVVMLWPDAD
ncbi:MAG: NAD(P)-dependent alcohol dehydrogenase [Chitinophagaceae bacterium]